MWHRPVLMVMKERINRPKIFIEGWSNQGSFFVMWRTLFLLSLTILLVVGSFLFCLSFSNFSFSLYLPTFSRVRFKFFLSAFGAQFISHVLIFYCCDKIWSFIFFGLILLNIFSLMWRVILSQGLERNIRLKRELNFFLLMKG